MSNNSNNSTIQLSYDINDNDKKFNTLFKGRLYSIDKYKKKKKIINNNPKSTLTLDTLEETLDTLIPSLLTLSSPKSCKHITNLCQPLLTYTKSKYPTELLKKSANEYYRKRQDELGHCIKNNICDPIIYESYRYIEIDDIIISIGHCYNCSRHNTTLCHKESEYINHADDILKQAVEYIQELYLNVRVGVIRFQSSILGSFEVQIACNTNDNGIQLEVLHSKISSQRWPSKTVFKKRLLSFINKQGFKGYQNTSYSLNSQSLDIYDGLSPYPTGHISSIDDIIFSDSKWNYENIRNEAILNGRMSNTGYSEDLLEEVTDNGKFINVIYAYDSRNVGKIEIGSNVKVKACNHPRGYLERYPLIGEVIQIEDSFLSILLKYCSKPSIHHINSVTLFHSRYVESSDDIPVEIETLIKLSRNKVGNDFPLWKTIDDMDREINGILYLTRTSIFHQFRNLVYDIEELYSTRNDGKVVHPEYGTLIDLQLCYSETILDWIFNYISDNDNCNMYKLEMILLSGDIYAYDNEVKEQMNEFVEINDNNLLNTENISDSTSINNKNSDDDSLNIITSIILKVIERIESTATDSTDINTSKTNTDANISNSSSEESNSTEVAKKD